MPQKRLVGADASPHLGPPNRKRLSHCVSLAMLLQVSLGTICYSLLDFEKNKGPRKPSLKLPVWVRSGCALGCVLPGGGAVPTFSTVQACSASPRSRQGLGRGLSTACSPEGQGLALRPCERSSQPLLGRPGPPTWQGELQGRPVGLWAAVHSQAVLGEVAPPAAPPLQQPFAGQVRGAAGRGSPLF